MKKLLVLLLTLTMLLAVSVCPVSATDGQISYFGVVTVNPGNVRAANPVYNYAWFDNMIIRDDAMAATQALITPKPTDYPYSHTYEEFIEETKDYSLLLKLDENTVASGYNEIVDAMFYVVVALGMTDRMEPMREYLVQQGIRLPANATVDDKAEIAVVYAALKYDAVYTLYGKHVEFPVGTTLDGAIVTIISALTGTVVPSGVYSLTGFAIHSMKNYISTFEDLPISTNPSNEEIFHWAKVITAVTAGDYKVPVEVYGETTAAQKEYVDHAYFASILSQIYDIQIDPVKLVIALQSSDELAVQKLILYTMLDTAGVDYAYDMECEELFDMACRNGWFVLENEFYTDITNYEIEVAQDCEKIWFTPFPLAGVLENSSEEYLTIKLEGNEMAPSSTVSVVLDPALSRETVTIESVYNAPDRQEAVVYEFVIVKNPALNGEKNPETQNDMVAELEMYVNSIVPSSSETASTIIDGVFQSVDSAVSDNGNNDSAQVGEGLLTTYPQQTAGTTYAPMNSGNDTTDRFDFDYLEELINGVYATDANGNIITTTSFDYDILDTTDEENDSVIARAVDTVKENPEIVAAPTGIIAVGALAGYLMSKKHRDTLVYTEEKQEETETEDE